MNVELGEALSSQSSQEFDETKVNLILCVVSSLFRWFQRSSDKMADGQLICFISLNPFQDSFGFWIAVNKNPEVIFAEAPDIQNLVDPSDQD